LKSLILPLFVVFRYQVEVLIIPLHQVFLPGVSFQGCRICSQFVELSFFGIDFIGKILLAAKQVVELVPALHLSKNVVLVEYQHERKKHCKCNEVFIAKPGWNMVEKTHRTVSQLLLLVPPQCTAILIYQDRKSTRLNSSH